MTDSTRSADAGQDHRQSLTRTGTGTARSASVARGRHHPQGSQADYKLNWLIDPVTTGDG
jgi:hypothetical protein